MKSIRKLDAVVVGAGFGGMYMAYKLREMGLDFVGFEAADDVGGVWYWNRYPGARCDLMSVDYSYGFSREIEQEWTWSEQFAAQPEILAYAKFVADRLNLRPLFQFETRVVSAKWDDDRSLWIVATDKGDVFEATYCIMATGPLSVPKEPEFGPLSNFKGELYRTASWPKENVSFEGKRVGLIGTGSTGIQVVPEVAKEAKELYVFQRTPSFTMPMRNTKFDDEFTSELKRHYPQIRSVAYNSPLGGVRPQSTRPYFSIPLEQRQSLMEDAWKQGGLAFLGTFSDLLINEEANEEVAEFVRGKIRQVVKDPETAEKLIPRGYPIFARRPCLDTHYYEAFNQPNVHLIDCIGNEIERLSDNAVHTQNETVELDALIIATGFDGMTGALLNFEVTGKGGLPLADKWADGASSYLGMMMHGFPNMFLICGPNGPAVLANIISLNEQNVDWICALIDHISETGQHCFEVTQEAEDQWMDEVRSLAELTLVSKAKTWYTGANIQGKPRGLTVYTGGFKRYRDSCDEIAAKGYEPLVLN
ncbi:MAG: NAD(P)/FAD-dependent oxidoreductase [Erythrobacter sp.]|uniref:flavin-containing monooxygenase n=1 Tax=Erythrobacter sp. TaxID=1042 RepID=UPI00260BC409|nr:NAD(P)/FAD-dependent oxidoreductase [Erythrobacter sp.]MDJ0979694.1 NAD(P)/FAD-dependent oxidoreductase [Erythrobacter sp.]